MPLFMWNKVTHVKMVAELLAQGKVILSTAAEMGLLSPCTAQGLPGFALLSKGLVPFGAGA
jgi:hypothetical protein